MVLKGLEPGGAAIPLFDALVTGGTAICFGYSTQFLCHVQMVRYRNVSMRDPEFEQ